MQDPTSGKPLPVLMVPSCHIRVLQVAGHKTGFGSPTWLETHEAAQTSAPPVAALLAAGAHAALHRRIMLWLLQVQHLLWHRC
jgi:hypothetical protein